MKTERIEIRLDPELVDALDEWRRKQQDIPSRSEAIRRMVAFVIEAKHVPAKKA